MELLQNKLQTLLKDKTSQGVSNNFGEMLIGKGAKFNAKNLANIDFQNVNPLGWSGDAKTDDLINVCCTTIALSSTKSLVVTSERNSIFQSVMNYQLVY